MNRGTRARDDYSPMTPFMAPGGGMALTKVQTPAAPTTEAGFVNPTDLTRLTAPATPVQPQRTIPSPFAAAPANRFGSSGAFQQSLTNQRALRDFKAGTFAAQRASGQGEQAAAQNAYAQTQLAGADLQTGGFFQGHSLMNDANARANAESGANVGLTGSQAGVNNAIATTQIPAQAQVNTSMAGVNNAQASRVNTLTPFEALGAQQAIEQQGLAFPGQQDLARANINKTQAEADAMGAGPAQLKMYQDQLRQAQQRVSHLESLLNQRQATPSLQATIQNRLNQQRPAAATAPTAQPPAGPSLVGQGLAAPATQPAAASPPPTQADLEFTAKEMNMTVDQVIAELKRRGRM